MTHPNRTPEDEKLREKIDNINLKHMHNTGWNGHKEAEVYQSAMDEILAFIHQDRKAQATAMLEKIDAIQHPAFPQMGLMVRLYDVRSIIKEVGGLE